MTTGQVEQRVTTYDLRRLDGSLRKGLSAKAIRDMAMAGDLYTDDQITVSGLAQWRSAASLAQLPVKKRVAPVVPVAAQPDPKFIEAIALVGRLESKVEELSSQRDEISDELRQATQQRNEVAGELRKTSEQRDALASEIQQAQTQVETLKRALADSVAKYDDLAGEHDQIGSALENALRQQRIVASELEELKAASSATDSQLAETSQAVEAEKLHYRESMLAVQGEFAEERRAFLVRIDELNGQIRCHPDAHLRVDLDEAHRERDLAHKHAQEAQEDREELVTALSHSQDALRTAEDLRRALEKSAAAAKVAANEYHEELSAARARLHELEDGYGQLTARCDSAMAAAEDSARQTREGAAMVERATQQRDSAIRERDAAVTERAQAYAERDSTRLAVGATQTDLVRTRRELDAAQLDLASMRTALSEQTARAASLEGSLAQSQSHSHEVEVERESLIAHVASLRSELERTSLDAQEQQRTLEMGSARLEEAHAQIAEVSQARDSARCEAAELQSSLAGAREATSIVQQRLSNLERELADERGRIVARDELIFRESLRSEERESEIRRLTGSIAAMRADWESENRRAEDALGQVAHANRDLAAARELAKEQNLQMIAAHEDLEQLTRREQAACAGLAAAGRERDEVAQALATAQAEIASREQQVSAERALRDQAESSSRQLLSSYEKLAEDTGRRITDLEVKLLEAAHATQSVQLREEQALASLADAHAQSKSLAAKLAQLEEQRAVLTRDRDSYAKQMKSETAARAAAEDKISAANDRAAKAEREGRSALERAAQTAMIALSGAKQRLDEDYARSRADIDLLEALVGESTTRIIATGGTVPGLPQMPRDLKAAAQIEAQVSNHLAGNASPSVPSGRKEVSDRPSAPPVTFRLIDGEASDEPIARQSNRPQASRQQATSHQATRPQPSSNARHESPATSSEPSLPSTRLGQPTTPGRPGGQRERVSHSSSASRSDGATDDDSSSRLDRAWLDDNTREDATETPVKSVGLIALTALGVTLSATISAIPEFSRMEIQQAVTHIAAWVIALPILAGVIQLIALGCKPLLARRIPVTAAATITAAPLCTASFNSAPAISLSLAAGLLAIPWMAAYAAWPSGLLAAHANRSCSSRRTLVSVIASVSLCIIGSIAAAFPWSATAPIALSTPAGGFMALSLLACAALVMHSSLRRSASIAAWGALAVVIAPVLGSVSSVGLGGALASMTPAWSVAFAATWCACAASSLCGALSPMAMSRASHRRELDETPSLVAHERANCGVVMLLCAAIPMIPALAAWRFVRGRSRRAESQLRSLGDFELWMGVGLGLSLVIGAIFQDAIGLSLTSGLLIVHAALCIGAAASIWADRFVRFPVPMKLLGRPEGGLDLPAPLVTVQRTALDSPNRPIVHPCGSTLWAAANIALGVGALWAITHDLRITCLAGPLVGLAAWLPAYVASRTRHQDALLISALACAVIGFVAGAGFVLESAGNPDGRPTMLALSGAALGMWALLLGWAISGIRTMSRFARSGLDAPLDEDGEPIAPPESPIALERRRWDLRVPLVLACELTVALSFAGALGATWAPWDAQRILSVVAALGIAIVALTVVVASPGVMIARARALRWVLVGSAATAAVPIAFLAAAVGPLGAISTLPMAVATCVMALVCAGVLGAFCQNVDASAIPARSRSPRPMRKPNHSNASAVANRTARRSTKAGTTT